MERDSVLYKIRRKIQVIAHRFFSDDFMSKLYFKIVLKEKLNLKQPKTFNEKLQWLKLYYYPNNDLVIKCADKYRVREYIKDKGYEDTLVPLIAVWDNTDDIDWNKLPKKFVLKCNHGCAYNLICNDKEKFDKQNAEKQLDKWLKEDFGASSDLIHDRQAKIGFFNLDGSKMELQRDDYENISSIKLPSFYNQMVDMASDLCKDFPFVRVDFFVTKNKYYFAELTFTPSACMMPFNPKKVDLEWGNLLNISNLIGNEEK